MGIRVKRAPSEIWVYWGSLASLAESNDVPIVVNRPRSETRKETLAKQQLALHRSDVRDDVLHDPAPYL